MGAASAVKEKPETTQGKIELRAEQAWIDRVDAEAVRLGLKRSAYIRMVVSREMDRAEAERRRA